MTPMPGQRIPIGAVPGDLPELPPSDATFDEIEAGDADAHLAAFGEWIWYKPRKGAPVKILAEVDRGEGVQIESNPRQKRMPVTISVKPNADDGIDPDAWTNTDEIVVHETRTGNEERTLVLRRKMDSDAGLITFEAS